MNEIFTKIKRSYRFTIQFYYKKFVKKQSILIPYENINKKVIHA